MKYTIDRKIVKNKKVIIAPYTKEGFVFRNNISASGAIVIGFLDNYKQGKEVIDLSPNAVDYDYIIIIPSKHKTEIAKSIVDKGFDGEKIYFLPNIHSRHLVKYTNKTSFVKISNLLRVNFKLLVCFLSKKVSFKHKYLYFAENFADVNLLESYNYQSGLYKNEAILVIYKCKASKDNYLGYKKVRYINNKLLLYYYFFFYHCLIIDHKIINSVYYYFSASKRIIQLWHGLPLKTLDGNFWSDDDSYDTFISSSKWFNENIFKKTYNSKRFVDYGYPRNDIFFSSSYIKKTKPENERKKIVYMPTYRDNGRNEYPLDFYELNQFCLDREIDFVLKYHPFVLAKYGLDNQSFNSKTKKFKDCSHVYIFNPFRNVYPLLANTSILITDYSSVYYDFLLVDRPIIFFPFDIKEYQEHRGGRFLVPYGDFTPGMKVKNFDELLEAIDNSLKNDEYADQRQNLVNKLGLKRHPSAPLVVNHIRNR